MNNKETVLGAKQSLIEFAKSIYDVMGKPAPIISDGGSSEGCPNNTNGVSTSTDLLKQCADTILYLSEEYDFSEKDNDVLYGLIKDIIRYFES